MCDKKSSDSSFTAGMLLGAVVGAILGLMIAPAPGEETRKKVRTEGEKYFEKGKQVLENMPDLIEDVKTASAPILQEVEDKVMEKIDQLADELDNLKDNKTNLKKRFFRGVGLKR